jgi:hypothetical protein
LALGQRWRTNRALNSYEKVIAMPISKSDVLVFSTGIAVGAVAFKTYPKWKDKIAPLVAGAVAGARDAFSDANTEGQKASETADPAPATAESDERAEHLGPRTVAFPA